MYASMHLHIYYLCKCIDVHYITDCIYTNVEWYNIMLQNEEVCGNAIYSSSEASGVNHIIHRS